MSTIISLAFFVTDTSSVDRHTLRLQTRKHRTMLKTQKEVNRSQQNSVNEQK